MTWIDDNKGQGPWDFTEQPDKFGYLNNHRWSNSPKGAADPISASEFCEEKGIALDPEGQHIPCGHWHKNPTYTPSINLGKLYWYQPSVDVLDGKIGMVSMRVGYEVTDAITGFIYDVTEGTWKCLGIASTTILSAKPQTCRLADDYMAYYCARQNYDSGYDYSMRLYVFEEGEEPRYTDVWVCDWGTGTPYYAGEGYFYNTMDCVGDRIVCTALIWEVAGVDFKYWQVKVSNDQGLTFSTTWTFPDALTAVASGYYDRVYLRMSKDGIVWLLYVRAMGTTTMVELWKSNAGATSWTKIWEKDYSGDLGGYKCASFGFDVSDVDGEYITISLYGGLYTGTYYRVFYVSSDYGINFTTRTYNSSDYAMDSSVVANDKYILAPSKRKSDSEDIFQRSDDYAVSFDEVDISPIVVDHSYMDIQKHDDEIVYCECGESYSETDYQDILYSDDFGVTWSIVQTLLQNTDIGEDTVLPSTILVDLDEPQVWSLPTKGPSL